ncbi:exopolyphosphatase (ExopolyPase) (Metaphosphatase) [Scheffersomyces stipitis CBS 6054]|uniref:Exopolyphosphatase (ExopolyPase) (Metaphosphatase) n=1 Tax=Scheffersomyces stipitis (strain ATCC 58785 / CBS 6054 / NBRC 10063 / NRRL Y-11545) TaxID=322104 RepID=A3LW30_PICST|nr:exopolyphosphatase (ExopolyPase) (Metaphosphatase) [Scheffersomyces stipitis CBS 6054]ABN67215.1 exopolyphosphatase (ExopolyPase) (Metaphosphatase) [Scheffersomyces stipitis CBS 6054]KAG2734401.1 hypothetical protein G9P44_002407 [Scheffersomyces stipitis]
MSVKTFLVNLRSKINANALPLPYKFVTGNQSADMDSVISAVSYSYFENLKDNNSYVIPLVNIPKEDLKLRRDIESLLQSHSITEDLLYFLEDFEILSGGATNELILVDHCNIQGDLLHQRMNEGKLKVVSIIDHHADEGVFLDSHPRIIHSNGSNSCLVFNYWYDQLGRNDALLKQNSDIIELLLGPLLIDTSNMTQKVEEGDVSAFSKYKQILDLGAGNAPIIKQFVGPDAGDDIVAGFYKKLKTAKKDLSGFRFVDVLRKDYKQFSFLSGDNVGFSSIGKSLKWVLSNYTIEEIRETLSKALVDFNVDALVITSSYTQKETNIYTREFCYYYEDKANARFNELDSLVKEPLQLNDSVYGADKVGTKLTKVNTDSKGIFKIYNQVNIKASRKQVVPIVKEALEKYSLDHTL